jgi:hypothetical protein
MTAALALLAAIIRLNTQDGILLNPDSYQFLLVIKALGHSVPLDASLGAGGDAWSIPFYRIGYPFLASPIYALTRDPESAAKALSFAAGTATVPAAYVLARLVLQSRTAAVASGLALAISFSAAAWSNFIMPEATAAFLLTLAMLSAYLAGRSGSTLMVAVAALVTTLLVLVRFELTVAVPSLVAFMALGACRSGLGLWPLAKRYLACAAGFLIAFDLALWLVAGDVMSGFDLNPFRMFGDHFVDSTSTAHENALVFAGFHDFLNQEPLLAFIGGAGLLVAMRWRPEYRWPLLLQVVLLLIVYIPRNDMRYFALLTPALALGVGLFSREAWEIFSRFVAKQRAAPALAASGVCSVALLSLAVWQADLTTDTWHATNSYEYTAATEVDERLADSSLSTRTTLCAYYAEAYYFVTGLPTRRLSDDDLSACLDGQDDDHQVVLIVDAPLRLLSANSREPLDGIDGSAALLEVAPTAPFLFDRRAYLDTEPIRGYILR